MILLADAEDGYVQALCANLSEAGYAVARVSRGDAVVEFVHRCTPALVLLDLVLPVRAGLDVVRDLRTFTGVPIIIVTAATDAADRIVGLELGADDYVSKPCNPREVVARVKAVLRRAPSVLTWRHAVLSVGPFLLDEARMRITLHGHALELTVSEFKLLRRLLRDRGHVLSRAQLLEELSAADSAFDRAIDSHIKNLRKRLGAHARMLRSVYGVGYQLAID